MGDILLDHLAYITLDLVPAINAIIIVVLNF